MSSEIVFINLPEKKSLPHPPTLRLISSEMGFSLISKKSEAIEILRKNTPIGILVTNTADYDILSRFSSDYPLGSAILVTDEPMNKYSDSLKGEEHKILQHIVTNRIDKDWTIHELRITINKIFSKDIFGIEKYLAPNTEIHRLTVTGSANRDPYNSTLMKFAESCRLGQHTAKTVYGITEELLMNAIYDAPEAAGARAPGTILRSDKVQLSPDEYCELSYACDGSLFMICIADPFGALTRAKLMHYLKKVLKRDDSTGIIDTKQGGAGLGFFKILYSSHGLICNVEKDLRTEIISCISIKDQLRDFSSTPRSIHFFER